MAQVCYSGSNLVFRYPHVATRLRPSTVDGYRKMWDQLKPYANGLWLKDVRTVHLQRLLERVIAAHNYNRHSARHVKHFFGGVFKVAKQLDYYTAGANPARDTSLPNTRPENDTYAYSLAEVQTILNLLPEPVSSLVAVAAFTGLRASELRGLRWEHYTGAELRVMQGVWRSHVNEPKTKKSKAPVRVIRPLAARLGFLRAAAGNPTEGWMFASATRPTAPRDLDVLVREVIKPALAGKVEWHGWHAFRRGLAT